MLEGNHRIRALHELNRKITIGDLVFSDPSELECRQTAFKAQKKGIYRIADLKYRTNE